MILLNIIRHEPRLPGFAEFVHTRVEMFGGWVSVRKHYPGVRIWAIEFKYRGRVFLNFRHIPALRTKSGPFSLTVRFGRAFLDVRRPSEYWKRFEKIISERTFGGVSSDAGMVI